MRKLILFLCFIKVYVSSIESKAQATYSIISSDYNCSTFGTVTGGICGNSVGANYKITDAYLSGSELNITFKRCNGSAFSGTVAIKEATSNTFSSLVCGNAYDTQTVSGVTTKLLTVNLSSVFTTGTRYFLVTNTSTSGSITTRSHTNYIAVSATPATCSLPQPTSGYASNISTTNFTANWNLISGATEYEIKIAPYSNNQYNGIASDFSTTNSFTTSGLISGVQYKFQVRAKCANNIWSPNWSETLDTPYTINTPINNSPINGNSFTSNTTNVSLEWNKNNPNITGLNTELLFAEFSDNSNNWTSLGTSAISRTVSVTPGNSYKWRVRLTKNGYTAVMSPLYNFTVQAPLQIQPITVSPTTGTQDITNFKFQCGYTGGNGARPGIEFRFQQPGSTTETIISNQNSTDVFFNTATNRWELNKTMNLNGRYKYRYILYEGSNAGISSATYDLDVNGPISINNIAAPLDFHCLKTITWTNVGTINNVVVELHRTFWDGTGFEATLSNNFPNNGSITWAVGNKFPSGDIADFNLTGTYKIRMYPLDQPTKDSWSNSFTIRNPTISLEPISKLDYYPDETLSVNWTKTNVCGPVSIELQDVNNANNKILIADQISINGPFNYQIPSETPAGQYKVKIYAFVTSGVSPAFDISDEIIKIQNSILNITSPASGSNYSYGSNLPIVWTLPGFTGNLKIELSKGSAGTLGDVTLFTATANDGSETFLNLTNAIQADTYRVKITNTSGIVGYSDPFTISALDGCPICLNPAMLESAFATGNEGYCAAQYLCDKKIIKSNQSVAGYLPTDKLRRDDAASMIVKSLLFDGEIASYNLDATNVAFPTNNLFTPFDDIENPSYPIANKIPIKVLTYLFWSDDNTFTTPFRKSGINFYPSHKLARIDFLKLIAEAFKMDLVSSAILPFSDIGELDSKQLSYLKKALDLNIISNQITFRPYDEITREEAFLMLKRIRIALSPKGKAELEKPVHYLFEQNVTADNVSIMRSMSAGNFAYSEHGFSLPDIGLPLSFGFTYSSHITDLPDVYRTVEPLGAGWTHNFNSYILATNSSFDENGVEIGKPILLLANGDGTFHTYFNTNQDNPIRRSIDNFNTLTVLKTGTTITGYEVKRIDLVKFLYQKVDNSSGEQFFRLMRITDRYDNIINLAYEPAVNVPSNEPVKFRLKSVTGATGRKVNFSYDSKNLLTRVWFPGENANDERSIRFSYLAGWDAPKSDRLQRFYTAKHSNGVANLSTLYSYGQQSENKGLIITSVKRPKGNNITLGFDGNRKLISSQQANGLNKTTYDRNPANLPNGTICPAGVECVKVAGTDGNYFVHKINSKGTVFDITGYNSSNAQTVQIQRPENDVNPSNPAWFKVNGLKHGYRYNLQGQVLQDSTFDKNGNLKFIEYWKYNDNNNEVEQYWEPNVNGNTGTALITYNYSSDGKYLQNVVQAANSTTNLTTTLQQHPNGKLHYIINSEGQRTNYYYDTQWNNYRVEYVPLNTNNTSVFDYSGRPKSSTNAKGQTSVVKLDENDNVKETIAPSPLSYSTKVDYDDNDNPITITNAKGIATTLTYDQYDRDSTITFKGATQKYEYNDVQSSNDYGKMKKISKPWANRNQNWNLSRAFNYVYDIDGFLKSNGYITNIEYNKTATNAEKNSLLSITGGNNTTTPQNLTGFLYDELVRLKQYTDNNGKVVGYTYDNNGNVTRISYPNAKWVDYVYDRAGRLTLVKWLTTTTIAQYVYVGSRLDYIQYGNGIRTKYNYDDAGRLEGMVTRKNNGIGEIISAYTYEFDPITNHGKEIITEPFESPVIPIAENTTYDYDDDNTIIRAGNITFDKDGDGNIIRKGNTEYRYDIEDNLIEIKVNGQIVASFEYDAFGNRRLATRGTTTTKYILGLIGLAEVLATTDADDNIQHYYIYGSGLLARADANNNLEYYHSDYRGSIIAMTNSAATYTHKYQYENSFGKVVNEWATAGAADNPFKYVGAYGIMYETADLYYMRARYYDPTLGRFNSSDPIWSTNLYPYAGNNGLMNVDLNGKQGSSLIDIVDGGVGIYNNTNNLSEAIDNVVNDKENGPLISKLIVGQILDKTIKGFCFVGAGTIGVATFSVSFPAITAASFPFGPAAPFVGAYGAYAAATASTLGSFGACLVMTNNMADDIAENTYKVGTKIIGKMTNKNVEYKSASIGVGEKLQNPELPMIINSSQSKNYCTPNEKPKTFISKPGPKCSWQIRKGVHLFICE